MVKNNFLDKSQSTSDIISSDSKTDLTLVKSSSDTNSYSEYHNQNNSEEVEIPRKPTTYYANAKIFSPQTPRRFPRTTAELSYSVFDDE